MRLLFHQITHAPSLPPLLHQCGLCGEIDWAGLVWLLGLGAVANVRPGLPCVVLGRRLEVLAVLGFLNPFGSASHMHLGGHLRPRLFGWVVQYLESPGHSVLGADLGESRLATNLCGCHHSLFLLHHTTHPDGFGAPIGCRTFLFIWSALHL